jgi:hypothetical protein
LPSLEREIGSMKEEFPFEEDIITKIKHNYTNKMKKKRRRKFNHFIVCVFDRKH